MYVTNTLGASIYQSSLFYNTGQLKSDTFFSRVKEDNLALVVVNDSDEPFTPVNVVVNRQLKSPNTLKTALNSTVTIASSRNNAVRAFLNDAKSLLERLEGLAEQAAESGVSDTMRDEINDEAQAVLTQVEELYDEAGFNGDYIAQGGTVTFSIGLDGEQVTINNANLGLSYLGVDSIDLTTESGASDAETAVADAIDNVDGQLGINEADQNLLDSRYIVNNSEVLAESDAATNVEENTYNQTTLENARASIKAEVTFATDIQGTNLRVGILENMVNGIINIGNLIETVQDDSIEESQEQSAEEAAALAQQQLAEFETQISQDTTPYEIITSDSDNVPDLLIPEPIPAPKKENIATLENMYDGIINISNLINNAPRPKTTYKPEAAKAENELQEFESDLSRDTTPLAIIEGGSNAED